MKITKKEPLVLMLEIGIVALSAYVGISSLWVTIPLGLIKWKFFNKPFPSLKTIVGALTTIN